VTIPVFLHSFTEYRDLIRNPQMDDGCIQTAHVYKRDC